MSQDSDDAPMIQALDRLLELRRAALAAGPLPLNDADVVVLGHLAGMLGPLRVDGDDLAARLAALPGLAETRPWDGGEGALAVVDLARPERLAVAGALAVGHGGDNGIPAAALGAVAAAGFALRPVAGLAMGLWRCRLVLLVRPEAADRAVQALDSLAFLFNDRSLDPLLLAERLQALRGVRLEEELAALRRVAAEQQQALAYYRDKALGRGR